MNLCRLYLRLTLAFFATVLVVIACTSANEQALARMTAEQRSFLSTSIDQLRYGMSERQVTLVMGQPLRGEGSPRVCYPAPKATTPGEICVRFVLYKASVVEWTQSGENGFEYTIELEQKK